VMTFCVLRYLPRSLATDRPMRGAANAEPSIGGEPSGASVIAASHPPRPITLKLTDARIWPWIFTGIVAGHAQAMVGQTMAFLVMDRLVLSPATAQPVIGVVLMAGAGAALLVQWGLIPRLGWSPRLMLVWGSMIAASGCVAIAYAGSMHALAVAFGIASVGFGFVRPGFTAGASLAVGPAEQGIVAGRVTSVNGMVFVLGPSIGIGLYGIDARLPYLIAAAALAVSGAYAWKRLARG
jgi:hypothetical protein